MTDDLKNILQDADLGRASAADEVVSDAFVAAIHERVELRRQRARRLSTAATVGCIGLLLLGAVWAVSVDGMKQQDGRNPLVQDTIPNRGESPDRNVVDVPSAEAIEREVEEITRRARAINKRLRLLARAETRHQHKRRMQEERGRVSRRAVVRDPMMQAALAAETAAQSMLQRGALLEQTDVTASQARSAYERVIEMFPETAAADRARRRLRGV